MPATLVTLGCRLNIAESEAIAAAAEDNPEPLVVVHGCAVTAEAMRQTGQAARRARRNNPAARIVVTGCAAEIDAHRFAAMAEVDHVVGNAGKGDGALWRTLGSGSPRVHRPAWDGATPLPSPQGFQQRVRGFVPVQTGCDHGCTFCIIPVGRGPSRSVPVPDVLAQVRRLVEGGHREIVLTGVDITAYGADLRGADLRGGLANAPRLGTLVRAILKAVPELPRLRLSSIDSVEADPDLLRALAEEERLMPQLHLSLQSGDDLILKRMRRRHSRADAIAFCRTARRLRPEVTLGADLIAGFPTETEAMAERSLELIEACGLSTVHVFPYSARPGTPAARMPAVRPEAIRERASALRASADEARRRFLVGEAGRQRTALVEHGGLARTEQFCPVRLDREMPPGSLVKVTVTGASGYGLTGRVEPGRSPHLGTIPAQDNARPG